MVELISKEIISEEKPEIQFFDYKQIQKTIEENVKEILLKNDLACKNDLILCMEYWKLTGQVIMKIQKNNIVLIFPKNRITDITLPESISRARRRLHHEKEITYDSETERKREKAQTEYREHFTHYKDWEGGRPISEVF